LIEGGLVKLSRSLLVLAFLDAAQAHASSTHDPAAVVEHYFAAHDPKDKALYLSKDFRMWFESTSGESESRSEILRGSGWDDELRGRSRIVRMDVRGDTVVVLAHEDNDFSLLIGSFVVDKAGLLERALYVPKAGAPSWRSALEPALPWLRENRPDALARVFPNGKLTRTRDAAKEWVEILRAWRKATGQSDPTDPD